MTESPPPLPKSPHRRMSLGGLIVLVGFLVIGGSLLTWYLSWRIGNSRAVARLEKTARDRGEPMNFSELAATYPPILDSSNAYVALRNIWAEDDPEFWNAFDAGERRTKMSPSERWPEGLPLIGHTRKSILPGERIPAKVINLAEEFLNPKQAKLVAVREAVNHPDFRAPIQFDEGMEALLPYLAPMKREAQLLQLQAVCDIEGGRAEAAMDGIESMGRLANCLHNDPFLIGQLVRLAIYDLSIETAERLVSQSQLDERQLARLTDIIKGFDFAAGLKRSLLGERALIFGFFQSPERVFLLSQANERTDADRSQSPEQSAWKSAEGMRVFKSLGVLGADKRLIAETYAEAIQCAETPGFGSTDRFRRIFDNATARASGFPPKIFAAMLLPSVTGAGDRFTRMEAQRRCALTAIAVERCRLRNNGALPESFAELPPELVVVEPIDPFTDQSLHYKKLPTGFLIYSTDSDREDNDGLVDTPKEGRFSRKKDIGFSVERPAR